MFQNDDDFLMGTPRSKFFDIVFHANRNLVQNELESLVERLAALELIAEERVGGDLEKLLRGFVYERQTEVEKRKNNIFIESMGKILSENE